MRGEQAYAECILAGMSFEVEEGRYIDCYDDRDHYVAWGIYRNEVLSYWQVLPICPVAEAVVITAFDHVRGLR